MIFQNNRHRQIFEAERLSVRKPGKKALAVLYLLTADKALWQTKPFLTRNGRIDVKGVSSEISPRTACPVESGKGNPNRREANLPV